MSVCSLRIASNTRRKNQATGEWEDKPNFFDVTVWGAQGENCARFLSKGRPVALDGRLEWREWETQDGNKRQSVEIVADAVQFLGGREDGGGNGGSSGGFTPRSDVPVDERDFQPAGAASRPSAPGGRRHPVLGRSQSHGRPVPPGVRVGLLATLSGRHRRRRDALPWRTAAPGDEISALREGSNSGEAAQPADAPA